MKKSLVRVSIAFLLTAGLLAGGAGQASAAKPLAKQLEVSASTSARMGFDSTKGGGMYKGSIRFTKVTAAPNRRITKKLAAAARSVCRVAYTTGKRVKGTPGIRLLQWPLTNGGLRLNDASRTKFKSGGSWEQYGSAPVKFPPYAGNRIEVQGGFWDKNLNFRGGATVPLTLGKHRANVYCETFTAFIQPG